MRSRGRGFKAGAYDPAVTSDGLTLDTPNGPVDLVAVERVRFGEVTPVTLADIRYIVGQLPDGQLEHVEPVAAGLGIGVEGVKRAVHRRTAAQRERAAA
jgi:hypothetical protein